jgi:anti-sigma factor RsiW
LDCRRFQELLARYVAGELPEPRFGEMVVHEAQCAACHRLAAEQMPAVEVPETPAGRPTEAAARESWLHETLRRTTGASCRPIERLLAAAVDGPLERPLGKVVLAHLVDCPDCRALAETLRELPQYIAAAPHLRADADFTRAVLARTSGPLPGFLVTLRAMWRRPGLVWEGALICALLTTPLLGGPLREWTAALQQTQPLAGPQEQVVEIGSSLAQQVSEAQSHLASVSGTRRRSLRDQWSQVQGWVAGTVDRALAPDSFAGSRIALVRTWLDLLFDRVGPTAREPATDPSVTAPARSTDDETRRETQPEGGSDELHQP